jgi:hypothetical protein
MNEVRRVAAWLGGCGAVVALVAIAGAGVKWMW